MRQEQYSNLISQAVSEGIKIRKEIEDNKERLINIGYELSNTLLNNNKIMVCGNGGSAADSQHFVAEIVGRFEKERGALPAIALTTDTSILTAVGNDYGFEEIFERQVEALGQKDDFLIGISTSGNSQNVIKAVIKSNELGIKTLSLTGKSGGKLKELSDYNAHISSDNTARIQEGHITILHILAKIIENNMFEN